MASKGPGVGGISRQGPLKLGNGPHPAARGAQPLALQSSNLCGGLLGY